MNALCGDVRLVFPDRLACCMKLAIQVGQTDPIVVDQIQRADPASNQALHGIASDPADSEHRHARALKLFDSFWTYQQLRS